MFGRSARFPGCCCSLSMLRIQLTIDFSLESIPVIRTVDPDPHSFSLLDTDQDTVGKNVQIKTENSFQVNLHNLHIFLLLSNLMHFTTKENSS